MSQERHDVSNNWQPDSLFDSLFRLNIKQKSNLHIRVPLWRESIETGGYPSQMYINVKNVFYAILPLWTPPRPLKHAI